MAYSPNIVPTDREDWERFIQDELERIRTEFDAMTSVVITDPNNPSKQAGIDDSTHSLQVIDYAHHEIHSGSTYAIHLADLTFKKNGEMGVLFKTPAGDKWFHMVYSVEVACKSTFDILEAPTVDVANYPTTFYVPRNRNRNSIKESTAISVRAVPAVNEVGLILDGDTTPITADGLVLHTEIIGGAKKGKTASDGHSHDDEYILKADTVYYFRVVGDNTGDNNLPSYPSLPHQ